jgi:Trk-type K+ transport system membrane component
MSLVDQSLIPFQTAVPQLLFLIWVVFAGNSAYVSFSILINSYRNTERNSTSPCCQSLIYCICLLTVANMLVNDSLRFTMFVLQGVL